MRTTTLCAVLAAALSFGCDSGRSAAPVDAPSASSSTTPASPEQSGATRSSDTAVAPAAPSAAEDEAAVRQVFLGYRKAIDEKSGERAASFAATRTIEYFDAMRRAALSMPAAELRKQPTMDRLMALTMRARFDAAVLRKLDGRGLFALGVDEGMVGKDVLSLDPGAVVVAGDTARIGLVSRGQEVPPESGFRFERERGHWRLDVMSIAPLATPALEQMLASVDADPDVAMVRLLEKIAGKPLGAAIWEPPDPAR